MKKIEELDNKEEIVFNGKSFLKRIFASIYL